MVNNVDYYDIIVLDTGVNMLHPAISCYQDIDCLYLHANGAETTIDETDDIGHGTAVVWLIKKKQPLASILSIKIFDLIDGNAVCSEDRLIDALIYIEMHYYAKVINISSSIMVPIRMKELQVLTKRLTDKGTVIVSAHHNNHSLSYPASFEWVIGVGIDTFRPRGGGFYVTTDVVVNILDSINLFRVPWKDSAYKMKVGSSFSCANVSAIAYSYIINGALNAQGVLECFKRDYPFEIDSPVIMSPNVPSFSIKKAVAFPCNKEIHSIIRFSDELDFKLVDVYDIRQSMNIGRSTSDIISGDSVHNYIVKDIDHISWETFDTLILGCVHEMFSVVGSYSCLINLINKALKNGKNIYAFENIDEFVDKEAADRKVYFPQVYKSQLPPYRGGRLAQTATPVVGVFGTASKQGKFTLQMELRRELKKMGCKVGQIGTEPSALLFGMDYVFPMGYHSTVYLNEEDKVVYCNELVRKLSEANPDIILVGSQQNVVSKTFENICYNSIGTYGFLLGTKPDFAIIMLSFSDDNDYIQRTISFLDSFSKTKTLAFVLFPKKDNNKNEAENQITESEYNEFKMRVENTFSIPVFLLGQKDTVTDLLQLLISELEH